jgi:hypothetical protein
MSENKPISQDASVKTECGNCRRSREHLSILLPFSVAEKIVDKPLRIRGVAMAVGMSRNSNIYTSEELQAFGSKLLGAPVYVEHVSVDKAVGKVTKTDWDGHALWYEAEIYESDIADKIRKGLVQHVSVGADYEAIDVVDGKVPHGLHNAELSLVAVPGIPETNIQVLERLRESFAGAKGAIKERVKEQDDVFCVFCSKPADYFVSICQSCLDEHPAFDLGSQGDPQGVEKLDEKELMKVAEKAATTVLERNSNCIKKLAEELEVSRTKLAETEANSFIVSGKLIEAEKIVEKLQKQLPSAGLIKDPPTMMPISEHVAVLESLLPGVMVERSSMGMQYKCQEIRSAIFKAKEKLKGAA